MASTKDSIKLSSNMAIGKYNRLVNRKSHSDKIEIADFIYKRFSERYIVPLTSTPFSKRNGFSIMANCCLMIEALESFKQGLEDTNRKSRKTFRRFLEEETLFSDFRFVANEFYDNIRCGILHQAETTDGWKITRKKDAPLLASKTINASKFLNNMDLYLKNYVRQLKQADWSSSIWVNLIKKIDFIISHC